MPRTRGRTLARPPTLQDLPPKPPNSRSKVSGCVHKRDEWDLLAIDESDLWLEYVTAFIEKNKHTNARALVRALTDVVA